MKSAPWIGAVLALAFAVSPVSADHRHSRHLLENMNAQLHGQVIDYSHNHGEDNRIWSESLHQLRDLYVYLPPGYDPSKKYPFVLYLHTFRQDEQAFLKDVACLFDRAIVEGKFPPMIIAAPDGSIEGEPTWFSAGSFFINTNAGCFEDFVMKDVWNFIHEHYPIRPEREAHAIVGASMGGFAAFNLGFKYQDRIKIVVGIFPPLNLRWVDCHERYRTPFDPCCWGWREKLRPQEVIARFYCVIPVRLRQLTDELYGRGPDVIERISKENPIEMLEWIDLPPGKLEMYIAYSGKDQFNIAAEVESFLYVAKQHHLDIGVGYLPEGKHDLKSALKLFPGIADWLGPRLPPEARARGPGVRNPEPGIKAKEPEIKKPE